MVQNPAFDFIIETSFFCTIFLIFTAIAQDKRLFFTTFDYIVAVIQALQFVITCITVYSLLFEKAIQ
jgi:hypothetical protein